MKKLISLLLVLMLAASLVGCSKKESTSDDENIKLTVWFYADAGTAEVYEEWGEKVHELYPNITLEFEELPYDSGPEKFTIACATNTTPDIYIDGYSRIAPAVASGLTIDLTEVYEENKTLFMGAQQDGVVDGEYRYLATHTGLAYGIMYNKDLAEQLGVLDMIPEGDQPWSYEDFLNVCRAAKKADPSIIPFNLYAASQSSDAWYYSMYLANGAELLNGDHTAVAFNSGENKERMLETLNFYKTLIDEDLVPAGVASMTDEAGDSLFCSGQMLFEASGTWGTGSYFYGLYQQGACIDMTFECAVMPTETGESTPVSATWGSYGFCAFNNGDEKVEAIKKAISVYLGDGNLHSQICTLTGKSPLLNNTEISYPTEHLADVMDRGTEYVANYGRSDFGILESWWSDFRPTHHPQLQDFYTGKIDAETLLNNWATEATKVIPQ